MTFCLEGSNYSHGATTYYYTCSKFILFTTLSCINCLIMQHCSIFSVQGASFFVPLPKLFHAFQSDMLFDNNLLQFIVSHCHYFHCVDFAYFHFKSQYFPVLTLLRSCKIMFCAFLVVSITNVYVCYHDLLLTLSSCASVSLITRTLQSWWATLLLSN